MSRYQIDKVLKEVAQDEQAFQAFKENAAAFLEGRELTDAERDALVKIDYPALYAMGAHPFLLNGFVMRVWPGDRRTLGQEYRQKIAPYGYPDFAT
jgi:hypothetical protein